MNQAKVGNEDQGLQVWGGGGRTGALGLAAWHAPPLRAAPEIPGQCQNSVKGKQVFPYAIA